IELLKRTGEIIGKKGFSIGNIDSTIVCEGPRLADFIPDMVKNISKTLGCDKGRVSVKAKTEEGLGFTGSGQGISAYAVALVEEMKEK
ncbi:MAG: 2-C-methyl-D-erythritol 2,4-cyclodiphosphate synthase, partial [Deltaproteobacteria bacterium]|nr:2-C-methyl-D-erythritol 2,4-cyclodiphosphate synthase [Deltaproteobacteria bacterium]